MNPSEGDEEELMRGNERSPEGRDETRNNK